MAGSLLPFAKQIALDNSANPGNGWKFFTYEAGTLTEKATYQDSALTQANTNPVIANGRGEVTMYGEGPYRVILKDANDVTIYDRDNVEAAQSAVDRSLSTLRSDLAATTGPSLIGWIRAGAGAVATTLAKWLGRQEPSLFDFMTDAQIADVQARTLTVDVTAAIAAAVLANPNKVIRAPSGSYKMTAGVTLAAAQHIKGEGPTSSIFYCGDAFDAFTLSSDYSGVSDCGFTAAAARTSGKYVKLSAATRGNFVRRALIENAFIGISIEAEAVINYFEDIEFINTAPATGMGIWINGGNDTFLTRVVMDAPVGSQPLCGIRMQRTQATWTTDCDMIHQGRGIQIDPDGASGGLITWCFFSSVACDLGTGDGLYFNPNNATIKGLFFQNCWFSSNLNGVNITKTGTGAVDAIYFTGCTLFNNMNRGLWNQQGANIELNNCRVSGNSGASAGTYAGIEVANNTSNFAVRGTRSGATAGFGVTQSYGLLIGSSCNSYVVADNDFIGNTIAAASDSSITSSTSREVRGNLGYKTVASGVASMSAGLNQISITHGLSGSPSVVIACPTNANLAGLSYWTGALGATTFNINTSANVGSNSLFSWTASLYN